MEKSKQVGIIPFEEETLKNMFIILFAVLIISFTAIPCNTNASIPVLNPATDGHYHYYYSSCALCPPENCEGSDCEVLEIEIENKIKVEGTYWKAPGHGARIRTGLVEFDISGLDGLYTRGEIQATIAFTIKDGSCCVALYSMYDANENGTIEVNDIETEDYIGEVCTQGQLGNTITFDVTSALEQDLFNPNQTKYSRFVLKGCEYELIEFYDHTNSVDAPRLIVSDGSEAAIPTLSEWGIIIFMTLILGISIVMLLRRLDV